MLLYERHEHALRHEAYPGEISDRILLSHARRKSFSGILPLRSKRLRRKNVIPLDCIATDSACLSIAARLCHVTYYVLQPVKLCCVCFSETVL